MTERMVLAIFGHKLLKIKALGGQLTMGKKPFTCKSYSKRGAHIMEITGDLTFETIDALRNQFSELRMQNPTKVILDCTGIAVLSSVGLGEFSKSIKWGLDNACDFKIVCFSNHVVEVLEIAGITEMIPLYPSLEMALSA